MSQEGTEGSGPAIKPALQFAAATYSKHFLFLLAAVYLATTLGQLFFGLLGEQLQNVLSVVYTCFFLGGLIKIMLTYCDGNEPHFALLFSQTGRFWKFLGGHLVFGLAFTVGFFFFVIPGLIFAIRTGFYTAVIAEDDIGPIDALRRSWEITRGKVWKLLLFNLAIGGILLIPAVVIGITANIIMAIGASAIHAEGSGAFKFALILALPLLVVFWQLCWVNCYRQLTKFQS